MSKAIAVALSLFAFTALAQPLSEEDKASLKNTVQQFQSKDRYQGLFKDVYGYAVFPNVGKGAVGVGGAHGNGWVVANNEVTGKTTLSHVSVGLSLGGQSFAEMIFLKDKAAYDRFIKTGFKVTGKMGVAAGRQGAATDTDFTNGIAVATITKGGLMGDISVGGQNIEFKPFKHPVPLEEPGVGGAGNAGKSPNHVKHHKSQSTTGGSESPAPTP